MAETKPTAATAAKSSSSVQPQKKGNSISWVAPLVCIIAGYVIWRFILGADSNFAHPDPNGGFWPNQQSPKTTLPKMYQGGIIVPILIGALLTVITFVIERFMTITKATGNGNIAEFIRKVQYHLANKNVDAAIAECDKQKGSVGNVMKAGLRKYKEMIVTELDTEQKVIVVVVKQRRNCLKVSPRPCTIRPWVSVLLLFRSLCTTSLRPRSTVSLMVSMRVVLR
jgi:biopolymer transport protein ExbB